MSNPNYDKDKFYMDEYGNLMPKDNKKWLEEQKDKLDNTTNIKIPKDNLIPKKLYEWDCSGCLMEPSTCGTWDFCPKNKQNNA